MTELKAVVYVSSSSVLMKDESLDQLLKQARGRNHSAGITGFLLHCEGNFMQFIEGPPQSIDAVYARIRADRRHHGVVTIYEGPVETRQFDGWSMAFAPAQMVDFLRLSKFSPESPDTAGDAPNAINAGRLLGAFWIQHRQAMPQQLRA